MIKLKPQKRKCDDIFSKIVRSYGKCERCGNTQNLNCAHIYSRRHLHTRYELNNALCLCAGCHFWAHENPVDFAEWLESYIGGDILEQLREKTKDCSKIYYDEIYKNLKEIYANS